MGRKATFPERLADAMAKEGLRGPVQLGGRVRVNKQTASKWINGKTEVLSARDLFKIADALKVSPRWLLGESETMGEQLPLTPDEQKLLALYKSLPAAWRDDWVSDGYRTLQKLTLPPTPNNPYPKVSR